MLIQQNCMFSFDEIVEMQFQYQEGTELYRVLNGLDFTTISNAFKKEYGERGPKGYYAEDLLRALIAMHLEKISTVKKLVQNLNENPALRYSCGFSVVGKVPSASTFSRFQTKLACEIELDTMFREQVQRAKELGLIGGENLSIDASKFDAYETAKPKSKINDDGLSPHWGVKRDTAGNTTKWFGWKIHAICDSDSELPVDMIITPANVHDGSALEPLLNSFKFHYGHLFHPKTITMDSGYDYEENYKLVRDDLKSNPIIALNARGSYAPPEGMNENYEPICSAGYPLTYYGKDGDYLKFRCPHIMGECECYYGSNWCSSSEYGYTRKLSWKNDCRYLGYPYRGSSKWQDIYNSRTSVERMFSRHKVKLNLDNVRSRGINKARVHALISSITLIASTIVKK